MKKAAQSNDSGLFQLGDATFWDFRFSDVINGMLGGDDWNEITRAGPFVPPISFPMNRIIVTSSFRERLDRVGLGALKYRPIVKRHIVELPWHEWDRTTLPRGVSLPRDIGAYLESAPHSAGCAKLMEDLWELRPPKGPRATLYNPAGRWGFPQLGIIDRTTVRGHHISESQGITLYVISAKAKDWLATEAGDWVSFRPLFFEPPPRHAFVMVNAAGDVKENPTHEEALGYVQSLGQEGRGLLRLINSLDWFIEVSRTGYVELNHVTASYKRFRQMRSTPREKQVELWMAFYDRDIPRLMAEPWQIVENPNGEGAVGPGTVEWQERGDNCEKGK
jgi:hypothetical protein